jgi:signal transduction histidine kinase
MLDETVKTVRRISSELRPSLLDDLGLNAAISWHLKEFKKRTGVDVDFKENDPDFELPNTIKTGLFRILQEALTNVARHAEATLVKVDLEQDKNSILLKIKDNGLGFEIRKHSGNKTLGILGMKERAAMMGGQYDISSASGQGTTITVKVPINENK